MICRLDFGTDLTLVFSCFGTDLTLVFSCFGTDRTLVFSYFSDIGILLFFIYQDDATLISQGYVGDPDNGLELQVWKYIIPVTNVTVVRAVTALDCWPVNQLEYGIFGGGTSNFHSM